MMNIIRIAMLSFLICFSCLFIASFIYSIRDLLQGGSMSLNTPLFLNSLIWVAVIFIPILIFCASPFGDKIISMFSTTRKPSLRKEEKINPAVKIIKDTYAQKFGQNIDMRVCAMDEPQINGLALGTQTAAISTGLLKIANDDEITAMLSHEAGHLHHKDSVFSLTLLIALLPTILLNYLLSGLFRRSLAAGIESIKDGIVGFLIGIMIILIFCIFFAYYVAFWVLSFGVLWLCRIYEVSTQWNIEYRADEFVMEMGFAPALIDLFERIEDEDIRNQKGFLRKYLYTHPPTALRIDKLERKTQEKGE